MVSIKYIYYTLTLLGYRNPFFLEIFTGHEIMVTS